MEEAKTNEAVPCKTCRSGLEMMWREHLSLIARTEEYFKEKVTCVLSLLARRDQGWSACVLSQGSAGKPSL